MKKEELIQAIRNGASVCVPIPVKGGNGWEYAHLDTERLLQDLEDDPEFEDLDCSKSPAGTFVWFNFPKED